VGLGGHVPEAGEVVNADRAATWTASLIVKWRTASDARPIARFLSADGFIHRKTLRGKYETAPEDLSRGCIRLEDCRGTKGISSSPLHLIHGAVVKVR
jgi:hypothetical protein